MDPSPTRVHRRLWEARKFGAGMPASTSTGPAWATWSCCSSLEMARGLDVGWPGYDDPVARTDVFEAGPKTRARRFGR